jgi:hypothetical protein
MCYDPAMAADSDVIWFIDPSWSVARAELDSAAQLLHKDPRAAAVLIFGADEALPVRLLRELPAGVAALARPWPEGRPMCVRKALWDSIGRSREVPEPQWEFLVRAAVAGHTLEAATVGVDSHWIGSCDDALPALAPASPGARRRWLRDLIIAAAPESLLGDVGSAPDAIALKAGLFQLGDWLDDSHSQSQSIEGEGRHRAGDYWHGIMHRREPDDSNAKYWFRRVGRHPVFDELAIEADRILAGCPSPEAGRWRERLNPPAGWDPFAFVDLCSHCRRAGAGPLETAARRLQLAEMLLLLIHTWRDAAGVGVQPSGCH